MAWGWSQPRASARLYTAAARRRHAESYRRRSSARYAAVYCMPSGTSRRDAYRVVSHGGDAGLGGQVLGRGKAAALIAELGGI